MELCTLCDCLQGDGWCSACCAKPSSNEIIRQAGEDFDAWRATHEDEVGEMDLLEQIEIYSADSAWHSRATSTEHEDGGE